MRCYFVAEPIRLSVLQVINYISKSVGNGRIKRTTKPVKENEFLEELSNLRFETDHSFLSLFLKEMQNEDDEANEEEALEDLGSEENEISVEQSSDWRLNPAEMRNGNCYFLPISKFSEYRVSIIIFIVSILSL